MINDDIKPASRAIAHEVAVLSNKYPSITSSHYSTIDHNGEPPKRLHNRLLINISTDFENEEELNLI